MRVPVSAGLSPLAWVLAPLFLALKMTLMSSSTGSTGGFIRQSPQGVTGYATSKPRLQCAAC